MKQFLLLSILMFALTIAKEIPKDDIENEATTVIVTTESATTEREKTTVAATESSSIKEEIFSSTTEDFTDTDELNPPKQTQKRKILYINQQQSGKFNVHLELNDVSLIVVPNRKDPQLSLLNLLLRSAQKSNNLKKNEQNEHGEKKNVDVKPASMKMRNDDEYSKYKTDNYVHPLGNEPYPAIESRVAPYKVDISSTLGQPSPVEIIPNANLMAHSPVVELLKPIPVAVQHPRIFKRSIDSSYYGIEFDSPVLHDRSISSDDNDDEELTESITNSLENDDKLNAITNSGDANEFVLLGAVENCGPGRRRNSYQICVPDHN